MTEQENHSSYDEESDLQRFEGEGGLIIEQENEDTTIVSDSSEEQAAPHWCPKCEA